MKIRHNRFKRELANLRPQIGIWSSLCSNIVAEIIATRGFDWTLVDMEHSPNDLASVLVQLQAYAAGDTEPVVRVPWNDMVMIKRILDLGAQSLLIPMVQSAKEAKQAVAATRYPPRGVRGMSVAHRGNRYGGVSDYISSIDQEMCVLVQVETRRALERVEEIAAVDGVDGVFFGPADISADFDIAGQTGHEDVTAAIMEGISRVKAVGKPTGILTGDLRLVNHWMKEGCVFVACGSDIGLLVKGVEKLRSDVSRMLE